MQRRLAHIPRNCLLESRGVLKLQGGEFFTLIHLLTKLKRRPVIKAWKMHSLTQGIATLPQGEILHSSPKDPPSSTEHERNLAAVAKRYQTAIRNGFRGTYDEWNMHRVRNNLKHGGRTVRHAFLPKLKCGTRLEQALSSLSIWTRPSGMTNSFTFARPLEARNKGRSSGYYYTKAEHWGEYFSSCRRDQMNGCAPILIPSLGRFGFDGGMEKSSKRSSTYTSCRNPRPIGLSSCWHRGRD